MSTTAESLDLDQNVSDARVKFDLESIDPLNCAYVFSKQIFTLKALLAAFVVLSHWNIWHIGQYASGWNGTALWLCLIALITYKNRTISFAKDWLWLIPVSLIAASFSIYENPWLNHVSMFILPFSLGLFFSYSHLKNEKEIFWDFNFFQFLTKRTLSPVMNFIPTIRQSRKYFASSIEPKNYAMAVRVGKGFGLLFPIGVFVIILLASADQNFNNVITEVITHIFDLLDWTTVSKALCIAAFTLLLLSMVFSWRLKYEIAPQEAKGLVDGVISSILMIGLLVLYATFIALQIDYMLSDSLPIEFSQAEHIAKSGFWQLFALSILNTLLFIILYGRSTAFTQLILRIFIFASGLILLSGCWRLGLYVYWYGLSYEKFFASYTSIFSIFVFIYLMYATLVSNKKNILKFIVFSAIWFYSVATIAPIEKVIYSTNVYLHDKADTRINLDELSALSVDIHSDVIAAFADKQLTAGLWRDWVQSINNERCNRKWYETNLSIIRNCG